MLSMIALCDTHGFKGQGSMSGIEPPTSPFTPCLSTPLSSVAKNRACPRTLIVHLANCLYTIPNQNGATIEVQQEYTHGEGYWSGGGVVVRVRHRSFIAHWVGVGNFYNLYVGFLGHIASDPPIIYPLSNRHGPIYIGAGFPAAYEYWTYDDLYRNS
jgi:hypothetical protein